MVESPRIELGSFALQYSWSIGHIVAKDFCSWIFVYSSGLSFSLTDIMNTPAFIRVASKVALTDLKPVAHFLL
jgi:hypothetical protein